MSLTLLPPEPGVTALLTSWADTPCGDEREAGELDRVITPESVEHYREAGCVPAGEIAVVSNGARRTRAAVERRAGPARRSRGVSTRTAQPPYARRAGPQHPRDMRDPGTHAGPGRHRDRPPGLGGSVRNPLDRCQDHWIALVDPALRASRSSRSWFAPMAPAPIAGAGAIGLVVRAGRRQPGTRVPGVSAGPPPSPCP